MICVSVTGPGYEKCVDAVSKHAIAEIRIDRAGLNLDEVVRLFDRYGWKLIATCRPGNVPEPERMELLLSAIEAGAWMVDIELGSPKRTMDRILAGARSAGCRVIVSHHDYKKTPPREKLLEIVDRCFLNGADIAKVACTVVEPRDNGRIIGIIDDVRPVIAIGMGEMGRITRVASVLSGSPFTYASQRKGDESAPGQFDAREARLLVRRFGGDA